MLTEIDLLIEMLIEMLTARDLFITTNYSPQPINNEYLA